MSKSDKPVPQPSDPIAPLKREAFAAIEAKAREVLRERGFTPAMIEAELRRVRRNEPLD